MTSIELNSVALPAGTTIERQLRRPIPDERNALFQTGQLGDYDYHTLLYDIFLKTDNKTITALGPPPLNLEQQLLPAHIKVNSHELPLTVLTCHKKLIILEATSPAPLSSGTSAVICLANGQQKTITLSTSTQPQGLSLVTVQKNNKLQWIRDWISYYRNEFGIQHVYIYDNNSDNQETLIETLSNSATVIPWNFPHGIRHRSGNKFCQVGALNHFKHRFGEDTIIFNFDIDELLVVLMMQMLSAGGMEIITDGIRTADDDNPRGYFELQEATQLHRESDWISNAKGKDSKNCSPSVAAPAR